MLNNLDGVRHEPPITKGRKKLMIDKKQEKLDLIRDKRIELQVEKWDLFARITPTFFLIVSIILITTGYIDFAQAFWLGLALFAVTAVTWWFWTIYTIRHLIRTLSRTSNNLLEVRNEFIEVKTEVEALKNEQ